MKRWLHDRFGHHYRLIQPGHNKPLFSCDCGVFWVAKIGWKAPHNPDWRTPTRRDTFARYAT